MYLKEFAIFIITRYACYDIHMQTVRSALKNGGRLWTPRPLLVKHLTVPWHEPIRKRIFSTGHCLYQTSPCITHLWILQLKWLASQNNLMTWKYIKISNFIKTVSWDWLAEICHGSEIATLLHKDRLRVGFETREGTRQPLLLTEDLKPWVH